MARNAYTLTEAQEMLKLCKVATKELLNGQAKSYRVGTRDFTALDIQDLLDLTKYYSNLVESLSGNIRSGNVGRFVPRDL